MLSKKAVLELVEDELYPQWEQEREKLDWLDRWAGWKQSDIQVPRGATLEHRRLAALAKTPWLSLVVSSISQGLYVDGYKSTKDSQDGDANAGPWETWKANAFDRRQIPIHRAALTYGYAFGRALPGEDHEGPRSVLRGISPRDAYAVWQSPADDEWPMFVIHLHEAPNDHYLVELFEGNTIHRVDKPKLGGKPEYIDFSQHSFDNPPWVRYGMPDLEGRCVGQVEPFVDAAQRINKTTYDRLLIQHFNSWKVRTIAGMQKPKGGDLALEQEKLRLRNEDLLVSDSPDTKFGTLDETPLEGIIRAGEFDIETLAAVSQTPTHELTGKLINLSADALVAARGGLMRKTAEWMKAFGASHAQLLRLGAYYEGNIEDARDVHGRVTWQDMEIRSLSQAVDALGKAYQMLGVPQEVLWSRIPGVDKSDVEEWKEIRERNNEQNNFAQQMQRQIADLQRKPPADEEQ